MARTLGQGTDTTDLTVDGPRLRAMIIGVGIDVVDVAMNRATSTTSMPTPMIMALSLGPSTVRSVVSGP